MAGEIEGRGLEWMNETVKLSDGAEVKKWVLALTYLVMMSNLDKLNGKEKEMAKEYGNLTLEQQARLMSVINDVAAAETVDIAEQDAEELLTFIFALEYHGFIASDKACRYKLGLEEALKSRRKRK